jgi:hypothetical protein
MPTWQRDMGWISWAGSPECETLIVLCRYPCLARVVYLFHASMNTSAPGSTALQIKGTRLLPETSCSRCNRIRPNPFGDRSSMAIPTMNFIFVSRPRTRSSAPPTQVSSTSTDPRRRSLPGRTIAVRSLCNVVRFHAVIPFPNAAMQASSFSPLTE